MKKAVATLITLVLLIPAIGWSKGEALKENFNNIGEIDLSKIIENGHLLSTVVDVTMVDGKEFMIAVAVDKKNIIATFTFASGKTVILSPVGIEVIEGEGYQDYYDIDNMVSFEPHQSNACLMYIIAYLILPYPLDLLALYYAFVTCF